jgi:hypothetical protein
MSCTTFAHRMAGKEDQRLAEGSVDLSMVRAHRRSAPTVFVPPVTFQVHVDNGSTEDSDPAGRRGCGETGRDPDGSGAFRVLHPIGLVAATGRMLESDLRLVRLTTRGDKPENLDQELEPRSFPATIP